MPKNRTERVLLGVMAVLVVAFIFVIKDLFVQRVVEAGDTAPNFRVTTENGRTISRDDFGGKVLVLNFWATWCPPCVEETPSLSEFARQTEKEGVVVLAVSVDKSEPAYRRFLQQMRPAFLTARDPAAEIPARFGSFKWPETYVIDRDGRVRQKYISNRNWTDPAIINEIRSAM
ncbi:MAG TPA: TlpA disulfide reductase family protein [Bryobacteraceae bacterium]|nr:TlpA disulfide reductase family protein [Bryobacteraceae bacterium]